MDPDLMRLSEIPIRATGQVPVRDVPEPGSASGQANPPGGLGSGVFAIVAELTMLLEALASGGRAGVIDLRSLPMSGPDRVALKRLLGEGEVRASFDADGVSRCDETAVSGVWWVEHRDRDGGLVAELLEVATVPAILCCATDDIAAGPGMLHARLATATTTGVPAP
jgi:hydrogenase-1 operon protein HyaF